MIKQILQDEFPNAYTTLIKNGCGIYKVYALSHNLQEVNSIQDFMKTKYPSFNFEIYQERENQYRFSCLLDFS